MVFFKDSKLVESDESYDSCTYHMMLRCSLQHDGDITTGHMLVREPVLADATFQYKERRMFALITRLCAVIETLQVIWLAFQEKFNLGKQLLHPLSRDTSGTCKIIKSFYITTHEKFYI